jgi:hypothetical protein
MVINPGKTPAATRAVIIDFKLNAQHVPLKFEGVLAVPAGVGAKIGTKNVMFSR